MTRSDLYDFIAAHALGVLSSVSAEGMPQSALVGIAVTEELEIVFDTLDSTRKYKNLISNAKASFVVGWEEETTVQFEGEAFLPVGEELERYKRVLLRKVAGWSEPAELAGARVLCRAPEMDTV
jgi:pyridoxine/pyridoxamine 5'-phosphate oxidase